MLFSRHHSLDAAFVQKILFILLVIGLSALALKLVNLWLLVFGAIVVSVILRSLADPLIRYLRFKETLAVLTALIILVGCLTGAMYFFGNQLVEQTNNLWRQLPAAWAEVQTQLSTSEVGAMLLNELNNLSQRSSGILAMVPKIASEVASGLANLIIVIVAGIFMAMRPSSYRDGIVRLFPNDQKDRARDSLNASGKALRLWLFGQFVSMVLVGSLTAIGLSIVGVPSAMALGLISGLAQFIPIVGPVVSAGPGLLLAASDGGMTLSWALVIYIGVSQLEANIITPMVQKHVASIPTVITLFAVLGFASLFGPLGVILATPLTVVIYTLVIKLYVRDTLGEGLPAELENTTGEKEGSQKPT
jgi:predicted PurR-regulated permease PerM